MRYLVCLAAVCTISACTAGQYDVSYSGGVVTTNGEHGYDEWPYSWGTAGWGGTAPTGGAAPPGPNGIGTGTCSGMITVTFTWNNGGDPLSVPPDAVIIEQTSTASWAGDSGSCANGIGDPAVPITGGGGAVSSGTKYTSLLDPGTTFQITCSPSASATVGDGEQGFVPPVGGFATVAYSAKAYAVRLTLGGTVEYQTQNQILIGQKFIAAITYQPGSPESANDTYTWTLSGGDPFADYVAPSPTGPAVYTPYQAPTDRILTCYFADPDGAVTVQCHVTLPSAEGLSFTLSKQIVVRGPTFDFDYYMQYSEAQMDSTSIDRMHFYGTTYGVLTAGIHFDGSVTTPAPWSLSGYGSWCWTQLVTSTTMWYKDNDGTYYDWSQNFTSGPPRLDNHHPYLSSFYAGDGLARTTIDTPAIQRIGSLQLYRKDFFKTYQLYKPPGADSRFVPLRTITWNWLGHASRNTVSKDLKIVQKDKGSTPLGDYLPHPVWTQVITNSGTWIPRD